MSKKDADALYKIVDDLCADGKRTRMEIAEYLGVSERTLYRWMCGDASFPRMVFIALDLLMSEE